MFATRFQRTFIREWREHRGMSLEALSQVIAMGKGNLSKIERGINPYTQGNLEKLAAALDCTPADLLSRAPGMLPALETLINAATPDQQSQIARLAEALIQWRPAEVDSEDALDRLTREVGTGTKRGRPAGKAPKKA